MNATAVVQPVPRPRTTEEYLQIRPQLIDTHGHPLRREHCSRCDHTHFTVEPCAADVPCPGCGSTRARCLRPSGHDNVEWHQARREAFEALCSQREAEGLPQVARWANDAIAQANLPTTTTDSRLGAASADLQGALF